MNSERMRVLIRFHWFVSSVYWLLYFLEDPAVRLAKIRSVHDQKSRLVEVINSDIMKLQDFIQQYESEKMSRFPEFLYYLEEVCYCFFANLDGMNQMHMFTMMGKGLIFLFKLKKFFFYFFRFLLISYHFDKVSSLRRFTFAAL